MQTLIFFGSDQYSAAVLKQLSTSPMVTLSAIITTRPKPVGRDSVITPNPVEKEAIRLNKKVIYYPDNKEEMDNFINLIPITPKVIGLTASFPRLLPPILIEQFGGRLYNIHPSLLPQYRNVAPVPYAIAMGDTVTGVSIFEINNGIDNGQIVAQADHPILPTDTTPTLLSSLFNLGVTLFEKFLEDPRNPRLTASIRIMRSADLIFTRKLSRESGYIEWLVLHKLIEDKAITTSETTNPLIKLRLTHHPDRTTNIAADMMRALEGYERVWSIVDTPKGKLTISLSPGPTILIAGKPKPITWLDFKKYHLSE